MAARGTERRLAAIDLNLLVTLDALLAERNVTRAARRLRLSQPAVSAQLAKLRDALGDPLLLPGPRGMAPTSLALGLEGPLRDALQRLVNVIAPVRGFVPEEADVIWRVGASDYGGRAIVEPALARLRKLAPKSRLAILQTSHASLGRQAEEAAVDLGFVTREAAPPSLRHRRLFAEHYMLAGRAGHPALRRRPTLAQFCRLDFGIMSPDGGAFRTPVDAALEARGLKRNVVVSVPQFLFLLSAIASSDIVALVPSRLLRANSGLRVVEPPLEVPGFEMAMVWHERVHRDPAHVWLRDLVVAEVGSIS